MRRVHDEERAQREILAEFFRQTHAGDRPPPFAGVVAARPVRRPALRRPAVAVAAVLLVAIAGAWLMPRLAGPGAAGLSEEEQLALAHELSSWRGPLDFLLETPGKDILFAAPSLELMTSMIPPAAGAEETQP